MIDNFSPSVRVFEDFRLLNNIVILPRLMHVNILPNLSSNICQMCISLQAGSSSHLPESPVICRRKTMSHVSPLLSANIIKLLSN